MTVFRDTPVRPGPSTWRRTFPAGTDDLPVPRELLCGSLRGVRAVACHRFAWILRPISASHRAIPSSNSPARVWRRGSYSALDRSNVRHGRECPDGLERGRSRFRCILDGRVISPTYLSTAGRQAAVRPLCVTVSAAPSTPAASSVVAAYPGPFATIAREACGHEAFRVIRSLRVRPARVEGVRGRG